MPSFMLGGEGGTGFMILGESLFSTSTSTPL